MIEKYTPEQLALAKEYEDRAFAVINDHEKFLMVMAEFDRIKQGWSQS